MDEIWMRISAWNLVPRLAPTEPPERMNEIKDPYGRFYV